MPLFLRLLFPMVSRFLVDVCLKTPKASFIWSRCVWFRDPEQHWDTYTDQLAYILALERLNCRLRCILQPQSLVIPSFGLRPYPTNRIFSTKKPGRAARGVTLGWDEDHCVEGFGFPNKEGEPRGCFWNVLAYHALLFGSAICASPLGRFMPCQSTSAVTSQDFRRRSWRFLRKDTTISCRRFGFPVYRRTESLTFGTTSLIQEGCVQCVVQGDLFVRAHHGQLHVQTESVTSAASPVIVTNAHIRTLRCHCAGELVFVSVLLALRDAFSGFQAASKSTSSYRPRHPLSSPHATALDVGGGWRLRIDSPLQVDRPLRHFTSPNHPLTSARVRYTEASSDAESELSSSSTLAEKLVQPSVAGLILIHATPAEAIALLPAHIWMRICLRLHYFLCRSASCAPGLPAISGGVRPGSPYSIDVEYIGKHP
ncbi:hypothetical protein R3P38DRAFT_3178712 [Favolaschia claudopus]|uniref:Uncharacterized protein n=1 Tax=Favolaschia claudopus TaxID=2862362 RepID=A0AAW0CSA7_9AGAR